MSDERIARIKNLVRDIPDFPQPGIMFKDITPILANPDALRDCVELLAERLGNRSVDVVVGMESRGFIFGPALAMQLGAGFVPARKPGKLPADVDRVEYALEYGTDSLEIHKNSYTRGARVLVVDDLIATGGTAKATGDLIRQQGGELVGYGFVIELAFLNGRDRLMPDHVFSLVSY